MDPAGRRGPARVIASAIALLLCVGAGTLAGAPPGQLIDVGAGHRVHLYCTGTGSPTVVVTAGAFSFDWGLIQPEVARFTRICTYDPSGSVWSDPLPHNAPPKCSDRVSELHVLLDSAKIEGPYVLLGYSIGGLYARLYAQTFRQQVMGMVIVDHAFLPPEGSPPPPKPSTGAYTPPVLISSTPIEIDLADDSNFRRLPRQDQDLHRWAMSLPLVRPTPKMAAECNSEIGSATLAAMPLIVIGTRNDSPGYRSLQQRLLALSRKSKQMIAEDSSHMVILDQPQLVIDAIRRVVQTSRQQPASNSTLP